MFVLTLRHSLIVWDFSLVKLAGKNFAGDKRFTPLKKRDHLEYALSQTDALIVLQRLATTLGLI